MTARISVALYWDFENLHASLCEAADPGSYARPDNRFKPQEPRVNVQGIVDAVSRYGPVAINRAYCNWQFFGRYREVLLHNAMELMQLFPPGGTAKNGADIRLCLDAMDDVARHGHLGTIVVVSGDSDFIALGQRVRAAGLRLVGVGTRAATNQHWAASCDEFLFHEELALRTNGPTSPP